MVPTSSEVIGCHHLPSTMAKVCSSRLNHRDTQSVPVTVAVLAQQGGTPGCLSIQLMRNTALMRQLGTLGGDTCSSTGKVAWKGKGLACRGAGMTWLLLLPVGADLHPSPRADLGMRSTGSAQQAPKERDPVLPTGQSHVPTAPAVPPTAVQDLRGLTWGA